MTASKVTLSGFIKVAPDEIQKVKKHLQRHIQLTREEPGCIDFTVSQRASNPLIFDVYEEFKDGVAFDDHQIRVRQSEWAEATKNVERNYVIQNTEEASTFPNNLMTKNDKR